MKLYFYIPMTKITYYKNFLKGIIYERVMKCQIPRNESNNCKTFNRKFIKHYSNKLYRNTIFVC